jgi:DNA-directed RNA polymerase beta subunit
MPFSESGIIPDVIINPHAFPSRMTIGMFVESLAGKSGALYGKSQDATPFQFSENNAAADHFGDELKSAGFNFHGNEPMYSGITGCEFKADIYIGVSLSLNHPYLLRLTLNNSRLYTTNVSVIWCLINIKFVRRVLSTI